MSHFLSHLVRWLINRFVIESVNHSVSQLTAVHSNQASNQEVSRFVTYLGSLQSNNESILQLMSQVESESAALTHGSLQSIYQLINVTARPNQFNQSNHSITQTINHLVSQWACKQLVSPVNRSNKQSIRQSASQSISEWVSHSSQSISC